MTRTVPVAVLVMVLAASRSAGAEGSPTGPLANGASITFSELRIHENNSEEAEIPKTDPDSLWHYFNAAHCACATASTAKKAPYYETSFTYLLKLEGASSTIGRPLEVWVGPNCSDDVQRPLQCRQMAGLTSVDELTPSGSRPQLPLFAFMVPTPGATACVEFEGSRAVWVAVDTTANSVPDYFNSKEISVDTKPPPDISELKATGAEGAIQLSWRPPDSTTDIYAYQALCSTLDDEPAKSSGAPTKALYDTPNALCEATELPSVTVVENPDDTGAGAVTLSDGMKALDKSFLCAEVQSQTANGLRISGLQNGASYKVALVVTDKFGNFKAWSLTHAVVPIPSKDFWEDLHERGSQTEGGLCLLAETYGDDGPLTRALRAFRDDTLAGSRGGRWLTRLYYAHLAPLGAAVRGSLAARIAAAVMLAPLALLALGWHVLSLPGLVAALALLVLLASRARRARLRAAMRGLSLGSRALRRSAVLAALTTLATASHARADGRQPYWEESAAREEEAAADDAELVRWHVGVRVGPYTPDIDRQFASQVGTSPGPYAQMFGGAQALPILDVDRILWSRFGQLGIGGSVGYTQKTARAFAQDSLPTAPDRERVDGDKNRFRILPMALTAVYRFTWLDDEYGIPVVPYVRGGLAYYLWWVSTPSGYAHSITCTGEDPDVMCKDNKALGGSLGYQGSIGLAIRAERIDPATAISMRSSGIAHAGIYAELSLAKVDGFGSEKKLSVGDRTWFAGVNFEF